MSTPRIPLPKIPVVGFLGARPGGEARMQPWRSPPDGPRVFVETIKHSLWTRLRGSEPAR